MFARRTREDSRKKTSGTRKTAGSLARGRAQGNKSRGSGKDQAATGRAAPRGGGNERRKAQNPLASWDWGRIRLWTVGIVFSLLWVCLWARAYHLQIVKGPEYAAMAKRQHTTKETVRGMRGSILDRNGNVLARSMEYSSVWANPALVADKKDTAARLSTVLNVSAASLESLLRQKKRFVWLGRKMDEQTADAVKSMKLPGVYLDSEYGRVYPYGQLAGQLLGFADIDDRGIEGLEKVFDEELAGRSITRPVERDASGRRLMAPGTGYTGDLRGRDVRLTIDANVQFFAEEALAQSVDMYRARWGGCLVVDVPSGDVLAWAQYPFFDPNRIGATAAADRRNRIATDMLEQGSTIKSFLVAAALEEKVATPDMMVNCEKGKWQLGRATLHDTHPYASLRFDKILHVSSNIGAAKIGLKLGAETYRSYLHRLGFGRMTGLPLAGEAKGVLRPASQWRDIDVATASFGQSFSATMAQMAQAYLCLASDGEKRPLRLAMDDQLLCRMEGDSAPADSAAEAGAAFAGTALPAKEEVIFSPSTMQQVRAMLREVVEEQGGTGGRARIPGLEVGGKTGTAQKAGANGRYGTGRVGSFVGMVPIEQPRYLILVLLDEPSATQYGGVVATPVFREVALQTMAYNGLLPDSDDPIVLAAARKGAERKSSGAKARRAVSSVTVSAPAGKGVRPAEIPGAAANVPSVVGLGLRSAVEAFAAHGVVPVIRGKGGVVARQTPEPGSDWPDGKKKCTLWLKENNS